jgi:hypothetical protein
VVTARDIDVDFGVIEPRGIEASASPPNKWQLSLDGRPLGILS